jgi:phage-related protein
MNVFELFAKLGLDSSEYEDGLGRARGMLSTVGGGIARGLGALGAASGAALGAAATGVVNLTTQAVNSYAEYEQMVGGIGKIFGTAGQSLDEYRASLGETDLSLEEIEQQYHSLEATQQLVLDNANNAWRTAGLGVNEYMSTVTTLSGALLGSLDNNSELAAQYADRAIGDMSDIANTYGYTMDEVSQIYTSVSRGLYQTIDTLTAGQFAGTKSGYEELINTMASMTDIQERLNITVEEGNYDYDNFVNAMSVYNEYMGIAGTTTNEAMSTIQGSMAMLQSTWQNLIAGLGNENADLGTLIDNVVTSAMAVVNNVSPIVEQALGGIASLIEQIAPVISDQLPTLIDEVLPSLLEAATTLIVAVADNLPDILSAITDRLPSILNRIIPAIVSLIPSLIRVAGQIVSAISSALVDNAVELTQAALDVLQIFIDSFADSVNGDGASQLVDTVMQIIEMIGNFLVENAPMLITAATELIVQLVTLITDPNNLQMMIDLSLQLILAIADGLMIATPQLVSIIPTVIANLIVALVNEFPTFLETVNSLIGDLAMMVLGLVGGLMGMTFDEVVSTLDNLVGSVAQSFDDFMSGLAEFITNVGTNISQMWTNIKDWFTGGIEDAMAALSGWWDEIAAWFSNLADNALTWASDLVSNFVSGITNGISNVGSAMSGFAETVASYIHFSEPDVGALSNFSTFAPDMVDLFASGIEENLPTIGLAMNNMSGYVADRMPSMDSTGSFVNNGQPIVVQAYFGNEKFDEYVVNSNQRTNFISGGRG